MNASWATFLLCLISRYIERYIFQANIRRSNEYRKYDLLLPEFLHNRPYLFTKYCVEKIELAKSIGENRIKRIMIITLLLQVLRKKANGTKLYNGFPSCECAD